VRQWLSAACHPERRDGVIATALLVLPWALWWAFAPHRHLDATAVTILVTLTVPLAGLWLAWAGFRNASRVGLADSRAAPGITAGMLAVVADHGGIAVGQGSVVADRGATAIGQVVYQQRPWVAGKPVRLADPPPLLAGRDDLLAELDTRLTADDGDGPLTVVLCGFGGVGKTSMAVAYAHRHLAEVGVAWQFAAENPTVLAAGFGELAAQLGTRDVSDTRDPVASVHALLAAFPDEWLLLFDNAPDRASVERFLPPAGRGRVLITSQNQNWPHGQALQVPALGTEVAADFPVSRTEDPDQMAAVELASELGGLPLALEQAGAYIQATGTTLARYVSVFRDRRADLLARGEAAGHPADVAATLGLALSRLREHASAGAGLLQLLACLAPEPVPVTLLLANAQVALQLPPTVANTVGPVLGDPVAAGDAVAALRRYSLATSAGNGLVLVHRLVQTIALAQMPADVVGQWEQAAAALVEVAVPADPEQRAAWPAYAILLPHARAVLDLTSIVMSQIAHYLGVSGSYLAARDLLQLIADAHRDNDTYGPEHTQTLTARANLAYWTGQAGDAVGARDQYRALLLIRERINGPEHQGTLSARANTAYWMGEAGDPEGARDQLAALLPAVRRVLGDDHSLTLTVRANLASWTGKAGDPVSARDEYAAIVPIRERTSGPEARSTIGARANLAWYCGEAGDPAGARDQYAALIPIVKLVKGPCHPDTLELQVDLARWIGEAGDPARARDQYAALLPSSERTLSTDHPVTLRIRVGLARWTGEAGDPSGACDQYAALLPKARRVWGPDHPDTLAAGRDLSRWCGQKDPVD
jgi:Tetratricopeptide repeat